jgi:hypothetical protein
MEELSDFILFCLIIPSMMFFVLIIFLIMISPAKPTKIKKSDIFDEKEIDEMIEKLTNIKNSLK